MKEVRSVIKAEGVTSKRAEVPGYIFCPQARLKYGVDFHHQLLVHNTDFVSSRWRLA
jgi:hypothetical protein